MFWWTILLWAGFWTCVVGVFTAPAMGVVLVPLAVVLLLLLLLLTVWFTVKSIIGLINLLGDRAP